MIMSTRGIFVMIGAWLYFGILPFPIQIVGGIITIFGIIIMQVKRVGSSQSAVAYASLKTEQQVLNNKYQISNTQTNETN